MGDEYFEELEDILIMSDIGINTVVKFVDKLKDRVKEKIEDTEVLKEVIIDELLITCLMSERKCNIKQNKL